MTEGPRLSRPRPRGRGGARAPAPGGRIARIRGCSPGVPLSRVERDTDFTTFPRARVGSHHFRARATSTKRSVSLPKTKTFTPESSSGAASMRGGRAGVVKVVAHPPSRMRGGRAGGRWPGRRARTPIKRMVAKSPGNSPVVLPGAGREGAITHGLTITSHHWSSLVRANQH